MAKPFARALTKFLPSILSIFVAFAATAADKPYDEKADAKADIQKALAQASTDKTPIIVVFGANWCGDCQMLNTAMKTGASAPLISKDFKVVKVDVGQKDKNLDLASSYGVPIDKGIPAVVILSPENKVLYVTKSGELANARKMGDKGIYDFLKKVTADAKAKK